MTDDVKTKINIFSFLQARNKQRENLTLLYSLLHHKDVIDGTKEAIASLFHFLDTVVVDIGHINIAAAVSGDAGWIIKLSVTAAVVAPR